ncbi:MAG TPA: ABC transporter permease, partial [Candidatus Dormibacteraeota bacterium]|nr:ABC transporter permease [Candidatus Dormibacteraeota bacterium]
MLRLIVVGALVRRLRFALAASAIVLGVALVSGTAILAQSVRHSYDLLLRQVTSGVDVYVRGPETDRKQGISDFAPVPDAMLAQVRPVAGVAVAQGQIVRLGQLVTPGGAFLNAHRPTYAYSWPAVPRISPFTLVSGRAPAADGEVVLDQATARADGLAPGGPIQVSLDFASPQPARLVGLVAPRQGGDLTGVGAVFVDPAWAQRLLRLGPQWDLLELAARPGVGPDQLRARVAAALPDDGTSAITSREFADAQVENLTRRSGSLTALLLALSLLAAVIGAGIILNTLGTLTWQRRRELALLRVLGQTRGQIWLGVVGEAVVVGLVASTAGALAGIPAALALRALVALAGQDVSGTRLYVEPATVLAAIGLGTLATA